MADEKEKRTTRDFLAKAHARFKLAADAEAQNRKDALDDIEFALLSQQWPKDIETQRAADGTPCLTLNQLPKFIRQVCNEQRQQRPGIQVKPVGSGADKETAEVLEGIIRHIETHSDAEVADDMAFEFAVVTGGPGWIRAITDYVDEDSNDQEIYLRAVPNAFMVYSDPRAQKPTREDSKFFFVIDDLPRESFKDEYPDSPLGSMSDFSSIGDSPSGWLTKDTIRVAEYFYCEETREKREKKRDRIVRTWHWAKITAIDILEKRELKGKYPPLFPVYAEEVNVNGKRHYKGLVRDAKDPQRQYNYHASAATEAVGIGTKAPWLVTFEQVEGYEEQWKQANVRKQAYLPYKYIQGAPPPTRNATEPPIQAMMLLVRQSSEDLMSTTGLYNPSLGKQQSPDESGKAILAQQKQGDVATLNFSDNLARTKKQVARYLIDQIPYVYDAPRIQRIIKPDESVHQVGVFNSKISGMSAADAQASLQQPGEDGADPSAEALAIKKVFDIGTGIYDVVVDIGPSYKTKREQAAETQLELMREVPIVQNAAPDLIIRNMDIPGADAIADRVKLLLPPQLLQAEQGDPEARLAQVQAQLMALTQQHQMTMQALQEAMETIKGKKIEAQAKIQVAAVEAQFNAVKWRMEQETKILIAQIEAKSQDASNRAQETIQVWTELHNAAADAAQSRMEHGQTMEQLNTQARNASLQSSQDAAEGSLQSTQDSQQAQAAAAAEPEAAD